MEMVCISHEQESLNEKSPDDPAGYGCDMLRRAVAAIQLWGKDHRYRKHTVHYAGMLWREENQAALGREEVELRYPDWAAIRQGAKEALIRATGRPSFRAKLQPELQGLTSEMATELMLARIRQSGPGEAGGVVVDVVEAGPFGKTKAAVRHNNGVLLEAARVRWTAQEVKGLERALQASGKTGSNRLPRR